MTGGLDHYRYIEPRVIEQRLSDLCIPNVLKYKDRSRGERNMNNGVRLMRKMRCFQHSMRGLWSESESAVFQKCMCNAMKRFHSNVAEVANSGNECAVRSHADQSASCWADFDAQGTFM